MSGFESAPSSVTLSGEVTVGAENIGASNGWTDRVAPLDVETSRWR
jgi:hypothetical protein